MEELYGIPALDVLEEGGGRGARPLKPAARPGGHNGPRHLYREGGNMTTAPLSPTSRQPLESGISVYSCAFNKRADIDVLGGSRIHSLDPSGSSCRPHRPHRNACNKCHQLIETIVYTGSMFCKVREPGHNICETPAIEGKWLFT